MAGKAEQTRTDHYQDVTDRIIASLEQGVRPWKKPWDEGQTLPLWPVNAVTGNRYQGINVLLLMSDPKAFDGDPRWCSYKQAQEKGWQVRKGEKSSRIYFYKKITVEDENTESGETESATIPILKTWSVFHASQIEGIPPPERRLEADETFDPLPDIEILLENSRAVIRHGGPRAFYSPATDHIQLPPKDAFARAAGYYSTALHELGHWTGGREDRVPRNLKGKFGSENYAREELRAEMASAFLCAALGTVNEIEENASYIASWLQVLKEDKHEIFRAASDAQKITEYCLQFSPKHGNDFVPCSIQNG